MSDYQVKIEAQLEGFDQIESKLQSLESKGINVKINIPNKSELQKMIDMLGKINDPSTGGGSGGTGGAAERIRSEYQKLKSLANEIGRNRIKIAGLDDGKNSEQIAVLKSQLEDLKSEFTDLSSTSSKFLNQRQVEQLTNSFRKTSDRIEEINAKMRDAASSFKQIDATVASNKTLTWLKNNTAAAKDYGDVLTDLAKKQRQATSSDELKGYTKQVQQIQTEAAALGKTGRSFTDELVRGFQQIGQFAGTYGILQQIPDLIMRSVSELKEMDDILTEISKTSDLTTSELKELGNTSFESASKYGRTAADYLTGVQEMSRSGYYGEQAERIAELSILAQAAGDLDRDMANSYLLASNAAYNYQGNVEKLNALLDGQNMITNRNSVSMADMAEATSKAASMASELGVQEDQLSAMIGTIEARTKSGGSETGTGIKSLLINLQNTNSDKIVKTLDAADASMTEFVDGTERLRSPIEILEDLQKTFNQLDEDDPLRSEILTNIGQKYHANQLSALLTGWDDYKKMLQDYAEGTGSAAVEAEKSANNWSGSLAKLSNAWTDLVQNFADSDSITSAINLLTEFVKTIDNVSEALGGMPALIGSVVGAWASMKGLGKRRSFNAPFYKVA